MLSKVPKLARKQKGYSPSGVFLELDCVFKKTWPQALSPTPSDYLRQNTGQSRTRSDHMKADQHNSSPHPSHRQIIPIAPADRTPLNSIPVYLSAPIVPANRTHRTSRRYRRTGRPPLLRQQTIRIAPADAPIAAAYPAHQQTVPTKKPRSQIAWK